MAQNATITMVALSALAMGAPACKIMPPRITKDPPDFRWTPQKSLVETIA